MQPAGISKCRVGRQVDVRGRKGNVEGNGCAHRSIRARRGAGLRARSTRWPFGRIDRGFRSPRFILPQERLLISLHATAPSLLTPAQLPARKRPPRAGTGHAGPRRQTRGDRRGVGGSVAVRAPVVLRRRARGPSVAAGNGAAPRLARAAADVDRRPVRPRKAGDRRGPPVPAGPGGCGRDPSPALPPAGRARTPSPSGPTCAAADCRPQAPVGLCGQGGRPPDLADLGAECAACGCLLHLPARLRGGRQAAGLLRAARETRLQGDRA